MPEPIKPSTSRTWLCELCGEEFGNSGLYKQHKVDHMQGRIPEKKATDLLNEEEILQPQQPSVVPLKPPEENKPTTLPPPNATIEKNAIDLVYLYVGTCPHCNHDIQTVPIEGIPDKTHMTIVAWCPTHKKLQQRIVAKI